MTALATTTRQVNPLSVLKKKTHEVLDSLQPQTLKKSLYPDFSSIFVFLFLVQRKVSISTFLSGTKILTVLQMISSHDLIKFDKMRHFS